MAWGQPDQKSTGNTGSTDKGLFLKIEEGKPVTVRIVVEEPKKRIVHKIRANGKIKAYANCPGRDVCPICKMPKSAKGDKDSPFTIITQTRYMVPVLNRDLNKVQILDIAKTPKDEIDALANVYGDPRNYDILLSRIGINTKPMSAPQQRPITQEEVDMVNNFMSTVDVDQYTQPTPPEEIRKMIDEQHKEFVSTSGVTNPMAAPVQAPAPVQASFTPPKPVAPAFTAPAPVQQPPAVPGVNNPFASPKQPAQQQKPAFSPNSGDSIDDKLFK